MRYQIVIMLMLSAAAVGSLLLVGLHYPKLFTADGALKPELYLSPGEGRGNARP